MPVPMPITRLEAVNTLLRAIGQSGVVSLLGSDANTDTTNAIQTLDVALREVLSRGWHCNTEKGYPIDPSPEGFIYLPANTMSIDTAQRDNDLDLVWRGSRLYDRANHTFTIGKTVYVDLVLALDFEELPQSLRSYIAVMAARRFATEELSTAESYRFTKQDEIDAEAHALDEDSRNDDRTMAQASPHVARMRRGQRRAGR